MNDLVSAAVCYPKYFWEEFSNEIIDKQVVVEDLELPYPSFIQGPCLVLRQPIQIITPLLPPLGFYKIYTDGCPNLKHGLPCGGGVAIVSCWPWRKLSAFQVRVAHGDPLETELRVIIAAARYALKAGFKKIILVSDCLYIIQALQGGRYIGETIRSLIRELLAILEGFEEKVFEHCPREGLALVDALARQMKQQLESETYNSPSYSSEEAELCEVNYNTQLKHVKQKWRKLEQRVPVLRFEILRNLPPEATPEDIAKMQWF